MDQLDGCNTKYDNDLYTLYNGLYIVEMIKIGRFRWLGQLFRMQEWDPCRKHTAVKPEGTRRVGGGLSQLRKM